LARLQNWENPIGSWKQVGQLCFVTQYLEGMGDWKKRRSSCKKMNKGSKFALL